MGLLSLFSLSLLLLPLVSALECPQGLGWTAIGRGCYRVAYDDIPRDHGYARYSCQLEGNNVDLASIPDQEVNDQLHGMAMESAAGDHYFWGGAHIGLTATSGFYEDDKFTEFRWDNTANRYGFEPWGEKDHHYRCGKMSKSGDYTGKWYTHHCDTKLKLWFCEYKVTNYGRGLPSLDWENYPLHNDPNVERQKEKRPKH